jgi:hypothetical protein
MLQISNLLLHTEDVPPAARAALASAMAAPAELRLDNLFAAAVILHRELGLDCEDARELVGLDDVGDCGCGSSAEQL